MTFTVKMCVHCGGLDGEHRVPCLFARLTDARLDALLAEAREWVQRFTDPPTATIELRALEVVAVLEELVARRRAGVRNA
jgi:hypothetical protein